MGRGIIETSPMTDLPKPGTKVARDRVLNAAELVAVWKGCDQLGWPFGIIFQILLLTGARREEIGGLRCFEISDADDAPKIKLEGAGTKSGEPHVIPISKLVAVSIGMAPHIAYSDFVFTTNRKTPVSGWSRAKARLDKPVPISHGRSMIFAGLQPSGGRGRAWACVGFSGRRRGDLSAAYLRRRKRAALNAWAAHLSALLEGRRPGKGLFYAHTRIK